MKFSKILLPVLIILAMLMPACGNIATPVVQDADTLIIEMVEAGYGIQWAEELAEIFMERNEGKAVEIKASATMSLTVENKLLSGPAKNNTGLFITEYNGFRNLVDRGSAAVSGQEYCIEDLTSVYEAKVDGLEVKNKLSNKSMYEYFTYKDRQWAMPWGGGPCGIVYNKTLFDSYGWEIPQTVSELLDLCEQIKADTGNTIYPFAYPGSNASVYWSYLYTTWMAQYEGKQNYDNFWECLVWNAFSNSYSNNEGYNVYSQQGRLESLKAFQSLFSKNATASSVGQSTGFIDPSSSAYTHTDAQSQMLFGNVAMVPTGDWIENEMKKSNINFETQKKDGVKVPTEIGYMVTPLLDQVDSWKEFENQTGDHQLPSGEVIDKSVLYQRYLDAKKTAYTLGLSMQCVVPSYVASKGLAKEFLKLMVSDEGCEIYLKHTGNLMPYKQKEYSAQDMDDLNLSTYAKSQIEFCKDAIFIGSDIRSPIRFKYGLADYNKNQPFDKIVGRSMTADTLFNEEKSYVRSMWNNILVGSGLIKG